MIYQLPSGRAIELSVEQYLNMSDEDLNALNTYNAGEVIEDPWFGSILTRSSPIPDELSEEFEFIIEDLTSITDEEKLSDPDLDITPLEE